MSDLLNKASLVMVPSGYKEDTVYSVVPSDGSGDLSFTRASNGTRVNSAGLVEVCPWNVFTYSEDFANADWIKVGSTISSNVLVAPNGTTTADKLVEDTSNGIHIALQITGGRNVSSIYAFSVYAKAGERTKINLFNNGNGYGEATFDLVNGTATLIAGEFATIESVGNGWYRCVVGMQENSTVGNFNYHIRLLDASGNNSYTGNGTSGAYIWGAQVNLGTAKPYFPTTDRLNVPRLTYQNGGGGCPSLLLEKQSTNLLTYSEEFDNAAWSTANANGSITRTANYGISPDGTQNADRIQFTRGSGGSDYAQVYQQVSTTSGTHTFSCWIKSLSGTPSIGWAYNGAVWDVVTLTNEWVRYTWTTTTNTNPSANLIIYGSLATPLSADFLVWGYQIEQSSYPTSYIPTTSSSATRVADECRKTGISSLIGQTSGSVFVESYVQIGMETQVFWMRKASGGFYGDFMTVICDTTGTPRLEGYKSGSNVVYIVGSSPLTMGFHKFAIAYSNNDFVLYVDGVQIGIDTIGTPPECDELYIDQYIDGGTRNTAKKEVVLFKTRLTNAELASLTTI